MTNSTAIQSASASSIKTLDHSLDKEKKLIEEKAVEPQSTSSPSALAHLTDMTGSRAECDYAATQTQPVSTLDTTRKVSPYRFEDIKSPKVKEFAIRLHEAEQRAFDVDKIKTAQRLIRDAHANKHGNPMIYTSAKYQEASDLFMRGIGVTKEEEMHARKWTFASGGAYGLAIQGLVAPSRLITSETLADFSEVNKNLGMQARAVWHYLSGIGAGVADVAADQWKEGSHTPSPDWFCNIARLHVTDAMEMINDLASKTMAMCKESNVPVPHHMIHALEQAMSLHKGKNATAYVFQSDALITYVGEFFKSTLDVTLKVLTLGMGGKFAKAATRALTSLFYIPVGGVEELAATEVIKLENAKYANLFSADGSFDAKAAKALWKRAPEVKLDYLESVLKHDITADLYDIKADRGTIQFLEKVLAEGGSLKEADLMSEIQNSSHKLDHFNALREGFVKNIQKENSALFKVLADLVNASEAGEFPAAIEEKLCLDYSKLIRQQFALLPEYKKNEKSDLVKLHDRIQGLQPHPDSEVLSHEAKSTYQSVCEFLHDTRTGEGQLREIDKKISAETNSLNLCQQIKNFVASGSKQPVIPPLIVSAIKQEMDEKKLKVAKTKEKVKTEIRDLEALGRRDFASLDPDGITQVMLESKATFFKKSVQIKFAKPGMLTRAAFERGPLGVALSVAYADKLPELKDAPYSEVLSRATLDIVHKGVNEIPGNLVVDSSLAALLHNMASRGEHYSQAEMQRAQIVPSDLQTAVSEILEDPNAKDWVPKVDLGVFTFQNGLTPSVAPHVSHLSSASQTKLDTVQRGATSMLNGVRSGGHVIASKTANLVRVPYDVYASSKLYDEVKSTLRDALIYNQAFKIEAMEPHDLFENKWDPDANMNENAGRPVKK